MTAGARDEPTSATRAVEDFRARHGREPSIVVRAPGRVNLIGEHTDYNGGYVLPLALPFDTAIAAEPVPGGIVEAHSDGFGTARFSIDDDPADTPDWGRYLHGMVWLLAAEGHPTTGWRATVASDIPAGASLSSSAALEVAAGLVVAATAGADVEPSTLARLGCRVENELLGLPSGIMDQLVSASARPGMALFIDCASLATEHVPLPEEGAVVILDTGTRRRLVDSAFAERRETCRKAADALGVATLSDITSIDDLAPLVDGPEALLRRARHVVSENGRTLAAIEGLWSGALASVGGHMTASHRSLRDDYEVSGPALDAIVETAIEATGCHGARMTGGGFAGCAVALVDRSRRDDFCREVLARYAPPAEQPATEAVQLYAVEASSGAEILVRRGR